MCWGWHKWGKWVDVTFNEGSDALLGQIHYCEKCNKKEYRIL